MWPLVSVSAKASKPVLSWSLFLSLFRVRAEKESKERPWWWFEVLDRGWFSLSCFFLALLFSPAILPAVASSRSKRRTVKLSEQPVSVQKTKQTFNFLMREILRHMMSYVPLPTILEKIVHDHASSEFAEFKEVIYSMLETYHYESSILGLANHVLENDVFEAAALLRKRRLKPYAPQHSKCRVCLQDFLDKPSGLLVYACGHAFHRTCLARFEHCTLCVTSSSKKAPRKERPALVEDPGRGRGLTMQQRAETVKDDDVQAQLRGVIARYKYYLRTTVDEETPKFRMLQLFDQGVTDIYQFTGARLTLAPVLHIERKIRDREMASMPYVAKYTFDMKPEDAKALFQGRKKKSKPKKTK